MKINRNKYYYDNEGNIIQTILLDISWIELRLERESELNKTDYMFLSDRTASEEWIDYRQFLRDLPQTYFDESDEITQGANAACDAWSAYPYPL